MNQNTSFYRPLRRTRTRSTSYKEDCEEEVRDGSTEEKKKPIEQKLESTSTNFYCNFECAICLEILSDPYLIPECCHRFCKHCIHKSLRSGNKECPTCRVHIVSKRDLRRDVLMGQMLTRLHSLESEKSKLKKLNQMNTRDDGTNNEEIEKGNQSSQSRKRKSQDRQEIGKKKRRHLKSFEEHFQSLKEFKLKYGHCDVPAIFKDNPSLGNWCGKLRSIKAGSLAQYQRPRLRLTPVRIQQLNMIGFKWTKYKSFDEHMHDLRTFKQKFGHCDVPRSYKGNPSLASWCAHIRMSYKIIQSGKKPRHHDLSKAMIKELKDVGFRFYVQYFQSFQSRIDDLKVFKDRFGHCDVPYKWKENPSLAKWCRSMRETHKAIEVGKKPHRILSQAMIQELDRLGFQWTVKGSTHKSFQEYMKELQEFKSRHGHCDVPFKCSENPSLGYWCANVRSAYNRIQEGEKPNHTLTHHMIKRLNSIGFRWGISRRRTT